MKKNATSKKLQLEKIKIASLSPSKQHGAICLTSLAQTTCPNCHLTADCA